MESDAEARGPIEGERYIVLDDLWPGEWYEWQLVDDWICAPFVGFHYNAMARARKGIWFVVTMAGGRKRLFWSGHLLRIIPR